MSLAATVKISARSSKNDERVSMIFTIVKIDSGKRGKNSTAAPETRTAAIRSFLTSPTDAYQSEKVTVINAMAEK